MRIKALPPSLIASNIKKRHKTIDTQFRRIAYTLCLLNLFPRRKIARYKTTKMARAMSNESWNIIKECFCGFSVKINLIQINYMGVFR